MAGLLDSVAQRTRMAGRNRLERLMFWLKGRQHFGINVFKIKELLQGCILIELPGANPVIRDFTSPREENILVMDISYAIAGPMMGKPQGYFVLIPEYNRTMLGFLLDSVDRIINMYWEKVLTPSKGLGAGS